MNSGYQESYQKNEHPKEINLREYFEVLKRRFWIIILVAMIISAAGYFYNYYSALTNTSLYQTSTRMIFGSDTEDMNTLMVMIKDPIIMELVREELQLTRTTDTIASQIEVSRIDDSQVVQISVIDEHAKTAADIANATAASFKSEIADILGFTEVQLLSEAKENPMPINETQSSSIGIISVVLGVIMGIGLAFLLDSMDDKVRKQRELEEVLGVPVIGIVANMNKKKYITEASNRKEARGRGESAAIKDNAYNE
ncbi:YveK family protein [Virgibacillus oceani]